MTSAYYLLILLLASIAGIVWMTAKWKLHPFFALLVAALGVGLCSGLPADGIVMALKAGFGHTMEKVGLLIILGTTLGIILEKTGATISMANAVLRAVSEKNAPAALAITGFIVGFPIFCDSGFIILSGLNHSLVKKSGQRMPVMATVLATSLYAVHCLVPPHPGITAAIGTAGADIGSVMVWGIGLAIPAALVGFLWSVWRGRSITHQYISNETLEVETNILPSPVLSFLPVFLPIALIACKSFLLIDRSVQDIQHSSFFTVVNFIGDPVMALLIGVVISLLLIKKEMIPESKHWLSESVEKAGAILAIIGAGGMFGEMLGAIGIGKHLGDLLSGSSLGIFFPFLVASILKTAQGSSTVAVITASSIVTPLLVQLGLNTPFALTLTLLSMGAGSMMISHANDAYFWVISRFSNMPTEATLKVYSIATILMGITVQLLIWVLYVLFA